MNTAADSATNTVQIVEVGARDGLQNESQLVATADKLSLLTQLADAGLRRIEATACVSPARVPQMADYPQILAALPTLPPAEWSALVANQRGLDAALSVSALTEVALFTAVSDAFAQKNIGCSVAESMQRFAPLAKAARAAGKRVRGYLSTVIRCPYAGDIAPAQVAATAQQLMDIGCDEISLGDTIGVGTPTTVQPMLAAVINGTDIATAKIAVHFHDTNHSAIANIATALDAGITVVDAAVAGLGGCPFAPGASGNVATEKVLAFLTAQGMQSDIDSEKLTATGAWICQKLTRPYTANIGTATR